MMERPCISFWIIWRNISSQPGKEVGLLRYRAISLYQSMIAQSSSKTSPKIIRNSFFFYCKLCQCAFFVYFLRSTLRAKYFPSFNSPHTWSKTSHLFVWKKFSKPNTTKDNYTRQKYKLSIRSRDNKLDIDIFGFEKHFWIWKID